jgi:hypothetical protein
MIFLYFHIHLDEEDNHFYLLHNLFQKNNFYEEQLTMYVAFSMVWIEVNQKDKVSHKLVRPLFLASPPSFVLFEKLSLFFQMNLP